MCCSVWIKFESTPPSQVIPTLIILIIRVWVIVLIFLCRVFLILSCRCFLQTPLGLCLTTSFVQWITAANSQYPDPHTMIFSSLLMKMQLTGENISQNSLKYLFLFIFYYQFSILIVFTGYEQEKQSWGTGGVIHFNVCVCEADVFKFWRYTLEHTVHWNAFFFSVF